MSTIPQLHQACSNTVRPSRIIQALSIPVNQTVSTVQQAIFPWARFIPGYMIMTPYALLIMTIAASEYLFSFEGPDIPMVD